VDVSTNSIMGTNGGRRTNKRWPETLKREIVTASFAPGSSVSIVARQYDVNANQVFGWRRRYGSATEAIVSPAPSTRSRLVPVTIGVESEVEAALPPGSGAGDTIVIEVAGTYLVRVGANFDCAVLRRVLECLGRVRGARENRR
jgi:transposase